MNTKLGINYTQTLCNCVSNLIKWDKTFELIIKNAYINIGYRLAGNNFEVKNDRKKLTTDILRYFTGNENETFPLNRGIYIYGEYGIGKSMIFKIIQKTIASLFWRSKNGFHITSVEEIIDRYKKNGNLDFYTHRIDSDNKPLNICINEFGKDLNEKIYGTNVDDILNSLFMIRYDMFQSEKYPVFITSNKSPIELSKEMPPMIIDRMKEMFTFIELTGESYRKQ